MAIGQTQLTVTWCSASSPAKGFCQADDSEFRGNVMGDQGPTHRRRIGADVDNAPAPAFAEQGSDRLGTKKGALEIDVDNPVPLFFADFQKGGDFDDTGRINKGIQPAQLCFASFNRGPDRSEGGDVQFQRQEVIGAHPSRRLLKHFGIDITDRHPRALSEQGLCDSEAPNRPPLPL